MIPWAENQKFKCHNLTTKETTTKAPKTTHSLAVKSRIAFFYNKTANIATTIKLSMTVPSCTEGKKKLLTQHVPPQQVTD